MFLSDRLRTYVEYERRAAIQNLQNLDALLADLEAFEQDYESMRTRADSSRDALDQLRHEMACQHCPEEKQP